MLKEILLVGAGGFVGSVSRYLISTMMKDISRVFPFGTLTVNIVGCFLIGLIYGVSMRNTDFSVNANLLLSVGFCGGFTTFSTFSKEGLQLLQCGNYTAFFGYAAGSVVLGLLAVGIGVWAGK